MVTEQGPDIGGQLNVFRSQFIAAFFEEKGLVSPSILGLHYLVSGSWTQAVSGVGSISWREL